MNFDIKPLPTSLIPSARIWVRTFLPLESMKLTSVRSTTEGTGDSPATQQRQHFSNSETHAPASFPSTKRPTSPDEMVRVVIRNTVVFPDPGCATALPQFSGKLISHKSRFNEQERDSARPNDGISSVSRRVAVARCSPVKYAFFETEQ